MAATVDSGAKPALRHGGKQNGLIEQPGSDRRLSVQVEGTVVADGPASWGRAGALTEDDRTMLSGLVRRHVEKHGGEAEGYSLAAVPAPVSRLKICAPRRKPGYGRRRFPGRLSSPGNPAVLLKPWEASPAGPAAHLDPEKSSDWSFRPGPNDRGRRSRFRLLTSPRPRRQYRSRVRVPWIRSFTVRSHSNRSSPSTPMTPPARAGDLDRGRGHGP